MRDIATQCFKFGSNSHTSHTGGLFRVQCHTFRTDAESGVLNYYAHADDKDDTEEWETWDVRRSLFDNHMSPTFEANMEHMFKKFGFYFPDAEFLSDPEGLLQYLVLSPPPLT